MQCQIFASSFGLLNKRFFFMFGFVLLILCSSHPANKCCYQGCCSCCLSAILLCVFSGGSAAYLGLSGLPVLHDYMIRFSASMFRNCHVAHSVMIYFVIKSPISHHSWVSDFWSKEQVTVFSWYTHLTFRSMEFYGKKQPSCGRRLNYLIVFHAH